MPEDRARNVPPIATLSLTALSAAVAETATFPIDIIKTRLQLAGGGAAGSAVRVAADIWNKGGALGFYRGLSPAILRHLFYTPIRIVSYEHLRGAVGAEGSLAVKALAGGASGVLAQVFQGANIRWNIVDCSLQRAEILEREEGFLQEVLMFVASPADLIKVRMQADSRLVSQGLQPRYAGVFDALNKIIRTESILGLWRGVFPNAQRAFLVNMGELACYDQAKQFIINRNICEDNVFAHSLASVASGLSATTLSCPADVVKTRMMNQATGRDASNAYRNSYDCLAMTVKSEGVIALWKGFFPTWARLGPWQFVFWVSYERFRHASGLSSF